MVASATGMATTATEMAKSTTSAVVNSDAVNKVRVCLVKLVWKLVSLSHTGVRVCAVSLTLSRALTPRLSLSLSVTLCLSVCLSVCLSLSLSLRTHAAHTHTCMYVCNTYL